MMTAAALASRTPAHTRTRSRTTNPAAQAQAAAPAAAAPRATRRRESAAAAPPPLAAQAAQSTTLSRAEYSEPVSAASSHASAVDAYRATPLPQQIEQLTHADWWAHLQPTEQNSVRAESANLVSSLITFGQSRISIGKALTMIHTVLEPHGVFVKYLANFNFSLTSAYRYMAIYRNARASLPDIVLREAMASGIDIVGSRDDRPLGQYTEAVAAAPPIPRNPTPEKARAWLAIVQEIKAEERKTPTRAGAGARDLASGASGAGSGSSADGDDDMDDNQTNLPDLAETDIEPRLKESYLVIRRVIRKLAPDVRGEFLGQLCGMAMSEFGIRGSLTVRPVAVPDDWLRTRGRPKVA